MKTSYEIYFHALSQMHFNMYLVSKQNNHGTNEHSFQEYRSFSEWKCYRIQTCETSLIFVRKIDCKLKQFKVWFYINQYKFFLLKDIFVFCKWLEFIIFLAFKIINKSMSLDKKTDCHILWLDDWVMRNITSKVS